MADKSYNVSKTQMVKLPFIIAVDFDGTLVEDKYPEIGPKIDLVFEAVKRWKRMGYKIVLWTCRDGEPLKEAVSFCLNNGLVFDAVNRNIPEVVELFQNDTRKVYANFYLDDKNMRPAILEAIGNFDPEEFKPWRLNRR